MPVIRLRTKIYAPIESCFDVARSIDIHVASAARTGERAIAGVTGGLMSPSETVTWEARHFGVKLRLTSRITRYRRPYLFVDEMVRGAFHSFKHIHQFQRVGDGTLMLDTFKYTSPFGPLGWIADRLFLERYMRRFLQARALYLKRAAEASERNGGKTR